METKLTRSVLDVRGFLLEEYARGKLSVGRERWRLAAGRGSWADPAFSRNPCGAGIAVLIHRSVRKMDELGERNPNHG